jgi:hypothetical protein
MDDLDKFGYFFTDDRSKSNDDKAYLRKGKKKNQYLSHLIEWRKDLRP